MNMSKDDSLNLVPVIDVHKDNFDILLPSIIDAVQFSSFIAVDVELSGLGNRGELLTKIIEERYKLVLKTAKSRGIVSFGFSCFRQKSKTAESTSIQQPSVTTEIPATQQSNRNTSCIYEVKTYNIILLCSDDYTVEPASLQFLVEHGFDFNKQYAQGVSYYRGNDRPNSQKKSKSEPKANEQAMRDLFSLFIKSKKSLVFHNGFVDLIFIYQHLYLEAPQSLRVFVADLFDMFKGGLFDTKYIAEYKLRYPATFLEYVFRKMQLESDERKERGQPYVSISFPGYDEDYLLYVERRDLSFRRSEGLTRSKEDICENFANHGYCSSGTRCKRLHDVCAILSIIKATSKRNRSKSLKRKPDSDCLSAASGPKLINIGTTGVEPPSPVSPVSGTVTYSEKSADNPDMDTTLNEPADENSEPQCDSSAAQVPAALVKSSTHRAGYDAFMTGYIFAGYLAMRNPLPDMNEQVSDSVKLQDIVNRVYLGGKDHPLNIQKSAYASNSKTHETKMKSLNCT